MKCPKCGNELKKNSWSGYECTKECGFKLYNPMYGRGMSDKELEELCNEGKLPYMSGFSKKDGTKYSARLKFDNEYKVILYWEPNDGQDDSLKCPKCGKPIRKGSKAWGCSGWKEGCDFAIWNTVAGHELTDKEKAALISKGETGVIKGFVGKNGAFNAKLKLDESKKVTFDFERKDKNDKQ